MLLGNDKTKEIKMIEGDFGITLPLEIKLESDETLSDIDSFSIKIFKDIHGKALIEKTFSKLEENILNLSLTEQESNLLPVGEYYYDLDWYQNDVFMNNLLAKKPFIVERKAGGIDAS